MGVAAGGGGEGCTHWEAHEACCLGRVGSSAHRSGQALNRQKAIVVPFKLGV